MMQLNMGAKGELIIPKKIRDHFGLARGRQVALEIKETGIFLHPPTDEDMVRKCEERAKKYNLKASDLIYGDKLYEEIF